MPVPPQLIYADNPGSVPASYQLPPGLDLILQSVVARIDGTSAASTFVVCLSIYSQDGKLIGRFRPSQTFAVGDTGVVTFAPFLKGDQPQDSPSVRVTRTSDISVADGFTYLGPVDFQAADFDTDSMWSASTNPSRLTVRTPGIYMVFALLQYDATFQGDVGVRIRRTRAAGGVASWDFTVRQFQFAPSTEAFVIEKMLTGDYFECMYVQKSGATQTLQGAGCFFAAARVGGLPN